MAEAFADQSLQCKDCSAEFVFTAGEQQFYQERALTNAPTRCGNCRKARKQAQRGFQQQGGFYGAGAPSYGSPFGVAGAGFPAYGQQAGYAPRGQQAFGGQFPRQPKQLFPATCASCSVSTEVPFQPAEGRPVYCRSCHHASRAAQSGMMPQ